MQAKSTTDALEIIYREHYEGKADRQKSLETERHNAAIARRSYALRAKAGMTQKELAARVGTATSMISRLEDNDYDHDSLSMLRRVAAALGKDVEIRFVNRPEGR